MNLRTKAKKIIGILCLLFVGAWIWYAIKKYPETFIIFGVWIAGSIVASGLMFLFIYGISLLIGDDK